MFGITNEDIQIKIAPFRESKEFDINLLFSSNELNSIIGMAEDQVLGTIPVRYRQLLHHIDEALTYNSQSESSYTLAFTPIANTLQLYINYPAKSFKLRNLSDQSLTGWSLSTNVITFDQIPAQGSRIYVSYDHDQAKNLEMLKDKAVTLAAIEIAKRTYFHRDNEGRVRFEQWKAEYDTWAEQIQRGLIGIWQLDNINTVHEHSTSSHITEDFYGPLLKARL
jgi:hypothetical protein